MLSAVKVVVDPSSVVADDTGIELRPGTMASVLDSTTGKVVEFD